MPRIRGKRAARIVRDPATGKDRVVHETFEGDELHGAHCLDTDGAEIIHPLDCGCLAMAAGRCHLCQALSCARCHGRCHRCQVPVCLEHSRFGPDETGNTVRLCGPCRDHLRRTRRLITGFKALLSPFVKWEDHHGAP